MSAASTDRLRNFIGGWFHQDYDIVSSRWEIVLEKAMEKRTPEDLRELGEGLQQFAERVVDDAQLERLLEHELACDYSPAAEGFTARQWLLRLSELLRREADRRSTAQA